MTGLIYARFYRKMPTISTRGPMGYLQQPANLSDGTMARALTPSPGVQGLSHSNIAQWNIEQKLIEVGRLVRPRLAPEVREQFAGMFTMENLGLMVSFVGLYAAAHLSPLALVAIVADGVVFLMGVVLLGVAVKSVAHDMAEFGRLVATAETRSDLDQASTHLARVIAVIGVSMLTALLFRICKLRGRGSAEAGKGTAPGSGKFYTRFTFTKGGDRAMAQAFRRAAAKEMVLDSNPHLAKSRIRVDGKLQSSAGKVKDMVAAHDLARPMQSRQLAVGTEIIQYVRWDGRLGTFCAYPGTQPAQLAILAENRIMIRFRVTKPIQAWESVAAEFSKGKYAGVGGPGGGIQLVMPKGWESSVEPIWGRLPQTTFGAGMGANGGGPDSDP